MLISHGARVNGHQEWSFARPGFLVGGLWVVISGVISKVTIVITHIRGLMALLITTHEPPSSAFQGLGVRVPSLQGLGFRVLGFRAYGCTVLGLRFRV